MEDDVKGVGHLCPKPNPMRWHVRPIRSVPEEFAHQGTDRTMSRPSLKITRHDDRPPPNDISYEVWNPITAAYEPVASLDAGLFRVGELAEQVRVMWVQRDPARLSLNEAPDPAEDGDSEWAEFRVSAQANRVYETRNFDQTGWKRAVSRMAAINTICNEVGYAPPALSGLG